MKRKTFLKSLVSVGAGVGAGIGAASAGIGMAPLARAVPLIGGNGLCPNAWNLAGYVRSTYPGVLSIGGVRADPLPDHPSGHALDIMVGGNTALGNAIHSDILSQSGNFGVSYTLWQVANHYDHIHVTVF
jgi:hypothetical protein